MIDETGVDASSVATDGSGPQPSFGLPDNFFSISVISSVLLFGILLVKIYGVAHFNINIVAKLASSSPGSVALGTVSIYSYFFLAMIGSASAWLAIASFSRAVSFKSLRTVLIYVTIFLFLLTPWRYFLDGIILSSVLVGLQYLLRLLWKKVLHVKLAALSRRLISNADRRLEFGCWKNFSLLKASMTSLAMISSVFVLITIDQPWAPAELITLYHPVVTNQTKPNTSLSSKPVAFVLSDDNGWLELLIDDDRTIIYVKPSEVKSRQICNLNDNPSSSDPLFESALGGNFGAHVLSCWRSTDQPDEMAKKNAPLPIRLLEWCPRKQYPHSGRKPPPCW